MNFIKFLTPSFGKEEPKKEEGEERKDGVELEIDQTIISKTFDEEIKSDESVDKADTSGVKSSKMQKKRKRSLSRKREESDSEEEYSEEDEAGGEKHRIRKEYKVVEVSNSGACFAHLVFKILGAFW